MFSRKRKSIVFTLALGIQDRPRRWHTPGKFFVNVGDMFERHGIDCYYVVHPDVKLKWVDDRTSWRIESPAELVDIIRPLHPGHVFIWNGNNAGDRETAACAERVGATPVFAEIGWFPQADTIYFDRDGTNFRSSIRRLNLDTVKVDDRLEQWKRAYRETYTENRVDEQGYVFVPLQDETDTNILEASPYGRMNDFVRDLSAQLPDERLIVRRHPRFMDVELDTYSNVEYRNDGNLYDWLTNATAIVGINSTVLLESLVFDKPIFTVGESLATGLGVYHEYASAREIDWTRTVDTDMQMRRRQLLSELVFKRMLKRAELERPEVLADYFLFSEMLEASRARPWWSRWLS